MATFEIAVALSLMCVLTNAQRPFFAGLRPIGYPQIESEPLSNRFGEDADLPILANGDGNLINRLESMPQDKQPFWYLNSKQYDELRKNPQTYPQRENVFANNS